MSFRCIVMGAAGRDFHDFATFSRDRAGEFRVVCFTATQITFIDDRTFPASLAGPDYPEGIPIEPIQDPGCRPSRDSEAPGSCGRDRGSAAEHPWTVEHLTGLHPRA